MRIKIKREYCKENWLKLIMLAVIFYNINKSLRSLDLIC